MPKCPINLAKPSALNAFGTPFQKNFPRFEDFKLGMQASGIFGLSSKKSTSQAETALLNSICRGNLQNWSDVVEKGIAGWVKESTDEGST